jgi:hypothetical protein
MTVYVSLVTLAGTKATAEFHQEAFAGWRGTIERAAAAHDLTVAVAESPDGLKVERPIHSLREAIDWVAEVSEWQS